MFLLQVVVEYSDQAKCAAAYKRLTGLDLGEDYNATEMVNLGTRKV